MIPSIGYLILITLLPFFTPAQLLAEYPRRDAIVEAVEKVSPAVVNISSEYEIRRNVNPFSGFGVTPGFDSFFQDFFDHHYQQRIKRSNLGSGVIIDGKRKLVLTNSHVISKSADITVILKDEREFKALVIGADPDSDLAVLKIDTKETLPDIRMGDSDDLLIGETVIAIGNPFGFQHTVTTGVISALKRSIKTEDRIYRDFIQTDASINPGNSGGPLLDINGKLIGLNTAIYAKAQGIGFAIPINRAKRILSDLIKYGEVIPAWTGLIVQDIDKHLARYLNLPNSGGVVVKEIEPGSPALQSGIHEGDILLKINGRNIASSEVFDSVMKGIAAEQTIRVTMRRKQRNQNISIKTKVYPVENALSLAYRLLGIKVQPVSTSRNSYSQKSSDKGVQIGSIRPKSYLYRIGAGPGDIIRRINDYPIKTISDFQKAIVKYRNRKTMVILLVRGGYGYYITVTL